MHPEHKSLWFEQCQPHGCRQLLGHAPCSPCSCGPHSSQEWEWVAQLSLTVDLAGMHSTALTNGIGNVIPEDKDVWELNICVCLQMKHAQLPGQHLPKLIMLQKMIICQIKQLLGNYKETWHKAGARLEKNIKKVWKLITGQTLEGKQLSRRCEVQPMTCRELQGSVKL